jgi:hypothetical protein
MNKMKRDNSKSWSCAVIICCATLLFCFSAQAAVQGNGTALMLEASPAEGGSLNIATGVHTYDIDSDVALKATPKPGYQFVCWLGNVTNTTDSSTTVFLNSPKMVIAVFERNEFETPGAESGYLGGGGGEGGGGLVPSGGLSDSSLEEAEVKNPNPQTYSYPHTSPEKPPVPTPEPATVTLFFAGFLMLANRRKNGRNPLCKT